MMAEALELWIRCELELPPSAVPPRAVLRRLCSGPTAPLWDFVTRHVRSDRNVKKIRGNLHWYGHLQEREGALRAEVERLRKELQALEDDIEGAQEVARRLEASLGAGLSRRWAWLQQGAELRLLGAEPGPDWQLGPLGEPLIRPAQSRAELSAILASGVEPEVLVSIKALCRAREELQRPRPPQSSQQEDRDWLEQAQAALAAHGPGAVLWALQELANHSSRALLSGPAPSPQAPPTLRSRLQECWGAVGGVWAQLPPLLSHLAQVRRRLQQLQPPLGEGQGAWMAASLSLAALREFRGSLGRALREPQKAPKSPEFHPKSPDPKIPKSPEFAPKSELGRLQRRLRRGRGRVLRLQQRLRFLHAAARGRRAALGPLQEQVRGVARAGLGSAPPPLEGEGRRRRSLVLGALGALGEPLPHPRAPPPLGELGGEQGALLSRAAILKQQLRQGALRARRAGAGPAPEVAKPGPEVAGKRPEVALPGPEVALLRPEVAVLGPEVALPGPEVALLRPEVALPGPEVAAPGPEVAAPGPEVAVPGPEVAVAPLPHPPELLAQLRSLSGGCRERIQGWARLRGLVRDWWAQPAQRALATPPGHAPFSHWLQRWRRALQAPPTPEVEGEGQEE